ncbi:dienelactone hydrolase family protein [Actinocorallia sp. A-T 12471]|uniref:dienelactone hydrolase family protein n=1 Tax=Actinocorallia sp. A-T 12471 TaxID=3089813 RepID=UPI0029CDF275|nr:dienelactone hydrolase family protein [Actinocorallia sp. A-T 12471]MDX6743633.1 dienelactone hydrolase family protein [Actinocorallia sp. A-T 12471]
MDKGHLSVPSGKGPFPGVVVLHDAFGMTGDVARQCAHLAENGYLAYAPALYAGGNPRCVKQVFQGALKGTGPVFDRIVAARDVLAHRSDCTGRVAVAGFCLGGQFALIAGGQGLFDAAAVNYGLIPKDLPAVLTAPCPVVGSFGSKDKIVPISDVTRYKQSLESTSTPHDIKIYDAPHGFLQSHGQPYKSLIRVTGMHHVPTAATDAWTRILTFLETHLNQPS